MNHCCKQSYSSACDEPRISVHVSVNTSDRKDHLICPKPRRVGLFQAVNEPMRWVISHRSETYESKEGSDLLDIILAKGGYDGEKSQKSVPQFFSGSPPSRVSNPLIKDEKFRSETFSTVSPQSIIPISATSPSRKGGCVRGSFGNKPSVRIEGFDCLDRDNRQNCSIPTLA